jgi:hypothetical protein
MESIRKVAERIIELAPHSSSKEDAINAVRINIEYLIDDIFKLVKNINQTSLNDSDRIKRIIELEEKYGIPKTHLI